MDTKTLYLRLLRHVAPYRRVFALSLLGMVVVALTEPAMPALLQPLLDGGFVAKDQGIVYWIPLLLVLLALVRGAATFASRVAITWVASRLVMDLRQAMFERLLSLPTHEYDNRSAGVLVSKFSYDASRVMSAGTDALVVLVRDTLAVLGLLGWMFYINWKLSLLVFTVMPLIALVVKLSGKRMRGINQSMQEAMGTMTRTLEESIGGHKLIKVFSGQEYERGRFHQASNWVRRYEVKVQVTSNLGIFVVQLLTALALAAIVYVATRQASADALSVGGFVSLFTAMGMLFAPIKRLTKVNEQLQQGLAAAQSVFELIDQAGESDPGAAPAATPALPPRRFEGRVELRGVVFEYEPGLPVLHGLDLTVEVGETVALVGASGSGKSTLANLLPRFYSLEQGEILLDGHDIHHLSLAELRRNIALVSQEVVLFNDSVAANIAYGGMSGADRAAIIEAARAAHAWDFIQAMPQGLDTVIGERGVKLSGGQRQRLAIARALLKDAPLLIFDEATSALDNQSEYAVQQSLQRLQGQRTTLIIAHRLSTIQHADRIVVMAQGRIAEIGSHADLLARDGLYASLYRAQSKTTE